jgi:hypothetical protein
MRVAGEGLSLGELSRDVTGSAPSGGVEPCRQPAIGLMSDQSLRGMIEIWFAVEKMKSNHVPGPDFAGRLSSGSVAQLCVLQTKPRSDVARGPERSHFGSKPLRTTRRKRSRLSLS